MYGNIYEYCHESLSEKDEVYFLDPKPENSLKGDALSCMGGSYKSSIEDCHGFRVISYSNEYIEPTGFRLIIRE